MKWFQSLRDSIVSKLLILLISFWIALAIIFGIFDLDISIAIVDEGSIWGNFGADYGGAPGYGLIAIALSVLIGGFNKDISRQKIPAYVIFIIGIIILIIGILLNEQAILIDGGAIVISIIIFLFFAYNKNWEKYRDISIIIILLAILNPLLFVQITKVLCGRIRFRDLAINYSNYTPWFSPPGPSSSGRSFPSGHTAMGWMFLPILIILKKYEWKNPFRVLATALILGWGFFVGISRVIIGAHFASDVLFSTGVASIETLLLYIKFYPNDT
ncbi:MAG: phosphatase PAP2 family protein [Promethearchaeota archaeon]